MVPARAGDTGWARRAGFGIDDAVSVLDGAVWSNGTISPVDGSPGADFDSRGTVCTSPLPTAGAGSPTGR